MKMKKENRQKKIVMVAIILVILAVIIAVVWKMSAENKENATAQEQTDQSVTEDQTSKTKKNGLQTDTSLVVKDGDKVNIDYVGTIDGVEFDGGNTQGYGTDLKIGSHSYIDDFEEQLIGHHVGETVEVYVTFPEYYGVQELNGKDALFVTTINGIY